MNTTLKVNETKATLQVLKKARALIAKPYGWTQLYFSRIVRTPNGNRVNAYCLLGAVREATSLLPVDMTERSTVRELANDQVRSCVFVRIGQASIPTYNDDKTTTKKNVLEVLDCAIHKVEDKLKTK